MSPGRRRAIRYRTELTAGVVLGVAAALAGCGQAPSSSDSSTSVSIGPLTILDSCIAEPIGANPAALYFSVMNRGPVDDALVGVVVESVDRADIHRTVEHAGIAWMEPAPDVTIPAGRSVRFGPGAYHVMLQTSSSRLRRGMHVGVYLRFQRAGTIQVGTPVVAYADLDRLLGRANASGGSGSR